MASPNTSRIEENERKTINVYTQAKEKSVLYEILVYHLSVFYEIQINLSR